MQLFFAQRRLNTIAQTLRSMEPALVARIQEDSLLISLRTVDPRDDALVINMLAAACNPNRAEE